MSQEQPPSSLYNILPPFVNPVDKTSYGVSAYPAQPRRSPLSKGPAARGRREIGSSSADPASEEGAIQDSQMGMTAESRNLYRDDNQLVWQELSPEGMGINQNAISASNKYALVVRREKRNGDTDGPALHLLSITVQSPFIKALLGPVFAEYQGINTNLNKLEFTAPFHEFFHRWTEFTRVRANLEDEIEIAHFGLLFDVMSKEITPHIEHAGDLLKNGVVSFAYLWSLFEPGAEIYSRVDDQDRLYLLDSCRYVDLGGCNMAFSLACRYIETDGTKFGFTTTNLIINSFANVKPISELNVLPSHLKSGMDDIRTRLQARGRKFEELNGLHHKSYNGYYKLLKAPFGDSRKRYVSAAYPHLFVSDWTNSSVPLKVQHGRVIIDCASLVRYNADAHLNLALLNGPPTTDHEASLSFKLGIVDGGGLVSPSPEVLQMQQMARLSRRTFAAPPTTVQSKSLSEEHYVLCSPTVKGFCLRAKQWVILYVDAISEIEWSSDAFKQLVLPHDYRRIVWAFVEAQISQRDTFDDVVRGKGKGFIMLLSGEPGTGKTLTAESVADGMEKPLYSMSAGELGNEAIEVERNLQRVLDLSTKWGAVLLIDECDVFMVKRSSSDLHRNQLVSVFLRLLEYYEGVMFLTTNRVESFDPAFESRIHLTINYPTLGQKSRLHIWRTFVSLGATAGFSSEVDEESLLRLAEAELNGRQIKNVVKTAHLLAAGDKTPLRVEHIETVMRVKRGDRAYVGGKGEEEGAEF